MQIETLAKFLDAWKAQEWEVMACCTQIAWRSKQSAPADWLQQFYGQKLLQAYEIKPFREISASASRVPVEIQYRAASSRGFGRSASLYIRQIEAMVICESAPYQPTADGEWGVNPISTLREGDKRSNRKARNQVIKQF